MSPAFGRRGDSERTAADREAARMERERRRALREGRPPPEEPGVADDAAMGPAAGKPAAGKPAAGERSAGEPAAGEPAAGERTAGEPRAAGAAPPADAPPGEPFAWEDAPEPRVSRGAQRAAGHGGDRDAPGPRGEPRLPGEPEAGRSAPLAPTGSDAEPSRDSEADPEPAAGEGPAATNGSTDWRDVPARAPEPQSTEPFEPVGPPQRRTVSLPRPQTDESHHGDGWDAPIGTVRVSHGGYEAQPGASGYPPYRKLGVSKRRRWWRRIVPLLALVLAIAAAAFAFLLFEPFHGEGHGEVRLTVPAGAGAAEIGDLLAERGVVRSGFFFNLRARLSGQRGELRSGRYTLKQDMTYAGALKALTTPPAAAPVINVALPEGPSRRELARRVEQAGLRGDYLRSSRRSSKLSPRDYGAPRGTSTLEGFLFPATYELRRSDATAGRLVSRQIDAFEENFAKVNLRRARARNLSRYDVLIIASMIEREALVARDRRLISAVVYNRLREGIPLGIDATIRYALNNWSRPLRRSELASGSAYNTRRRRGLPPGPIGNPGLAAMRAAANPANVDYLFYVVKPCGNGAHAFSSTDAEFQRDVAAYNRARDRRGGRDPSRC